MRLRSEFLQDGPVGADHAMQKLRLRSRPTVCKRRVTRGHVHRGHFVRTQRHRWRCLDVVAQAHLPRDLYYSPISDQLGYFHGGDVQRIRKRIAYRHMPHESFAVIVGRVLLVVEFKGRGLVIDGCRGCNHRLHAINGVVKSRRIYERLEHRPRLAVSQRMIQLALPVIPPADYGFDFAGPRINGYERNLYLRYGLAVSLLRGFLTPLLVFFCQQ